MRREISSDNRGTTILGLAGCHTRLAILLVLAAASSLIDLPLANAVLHPSRTRLRIRSRPASRPAPSRESSPRWTSTSPASGSSSSTRTRPRSTRCTSKGPGPTRHFRTALPAERRRVAAAAPTSRSTTPPAQRAENLYYSPDGTRSSATRPPGAAFRPSPRTAGRSAASASTTKDISGPATSTTRKMEEFEPTGGRPDQNRRRQRHRLALPGQFRPLEQRHVRAAVRRPGCGPIHGRKRLRRGLGPGLRHHDEREGRDQRNQACRLYRRLQQGLGIRHRHGLPARDLRRRSRLLDQRNRGR